MSAPQHEDMEFKTLDGLTIRGWFYPAAQYGPAVILNPGFNCVKEMFVPDVAQHFQSAGISALIYDPRTLGESDGLPRNDIDPISQASDYQDALTFLKSQHLVDSSKIAYWGFSFAGMVALTAAALDKRASAVIAVCPLTSFEFTPEKWPRVLARASQDRESRAAGNPPHYLPVLTDKGENPAGFGIGTAKEDFQLILTAKSLAPRYENRTTIQSYYRIAAWQPFGLMPYVSPTPIMMITALNDQVSRAENQEKLFHQFQDPKNLELVPDKGHMDALSGDGFPLLMKKQVEFLRMQWG